jgi:hypothetical protein
MAILQTSDFVGEYKISTSRFSELDKYIEKYEKYYLLRLMGKDLYDLFIADLTGTTPQVPQTTRFINIFEPFDIIPNLSNGLVISEGIKVMLIQFIYFQYIINTNDFNTISGQVQSSNENSTNNSYKGNIIEVYNKAIDNYRNIQEYIESDSLTYPEIESSYYEFLQYASGI